MGKILVIGASGFVGRPLARALLAEGHAVRCLARNPSKVEDLASAGCEVARGDISDLDTIRRALETVEAAYISVHTLSRQAESQAGRNFMDIETEGLRNIVTAGQEHGVRRLIYVTSLGITPDGPSTWVRGRWQAEQFLLRSGLDVTILRPGQIVGQGGQGFDLMMGQARRKVALVLGGGRGTMRNIALDDLVYYLVGVLDDPRAVGQIYEVGCDDVLTGDQMIDIAAEVLGRRPPLKIHLPAAVLGAFAPALERMTGLPRGSIRGLLDGLGIDLDGDPLPIRAILPRPPLPYRQAVERALTLEKS